MNERIRKADAQVLTRTGFYRIWQGFQSGGLTYLQAYDLTEALHRRIAWDGEPMYSHYESFRRQHWKAKKKAQSPVA